MLYMKTVSSPMSSSFQRSNLQCQHIGQLLRLLPSSNDQFIPSAMSNSISAQHPYYNEDIDFAALADQDADFAVILKTNNGRIDWQDPKALQ